MTRYVLGRLSQLVVVVVGVLLVVFLVLYIVAEPARMTLPIGASQGQIDAFNRANGLDLPLMTQLGNFLSDAVRGDFGTSIMLKEDALGAALERLPATILLTFPPVILGGALGILFGAMAARRPHSVFDQFFNTTSYTVASTADFWIAIMLILVLAVNLPFLPTGGFNPKPQVLILPWIVLSLGPFAQLFQLTRSTMIVEYKRLYVLASYARGMSDSRVAVRSVFPNVLLASLTMIMYELARVFIGTAIVIEVVFAWPGLGRLAAEALGRGDIFLIEALVLVGAIATAAINLLADILYFVVDPRTKHLVDSRRQHGRARA